MKNRYDFILLFDAQDANPNGDPDAGNLPRLDAESGQGLVTDVCLKRKVRNFIQTAHPDQRIYFTEGAVHNQQHAEAYKALDLGDAKKGKAAERDKAKAWMCQNFYDIRTFGAVMSTEVNCGQVRGPVQLSFARSIDPIVSSEHAITRTSVTNEKDIEKGRTMGRKFTIPYGLYRAHGFVNPYLAEQTGFSDDDLELFFTAVENAFQFDQSAARPAGSMAVRSLLVFKHDNQLGKAPSHALFDLVRVQRTDESKAARAFSDYTVSVDEAAVPEGVTLIRRI
ncbi:MAG: type I-C CRISPR-associated protein Cas7/Csd2 [Chthoniobacterales bacterium]|nr:type I-C CRISPR-associated protein Cas7/Csd2 [Chthoniobacterales bacterium]